MNLKKVWYGNFQFSTSPAFCNRQTGELYINVPKFSTFNQNEKFYILLHEFGHLKLNTTDEKKADKYASDLYLKQGYSITDSVKALASGLKFNKAEDYDRLKMQFDRAKKYDLEKNNHDNKLNMVLPNMNFSSMDGDTSIITKIVNGLNGISSGVNNISSIKSTDKIFNPAEKTASILDTTATLKGAPVVKKNNNFMYIGISIIIIIVIITIVVLKKTK